MTPRPRLCLTLGDPCGIGAELLVRTLPELAASAELTVVGPRAAFDLLPAHPQAAWSWQEDGDGLRFEAIWEGRRGAAQWLDPHGDESLDLVLGQASATGGRCALAAVRTGANRVMAGLENALVTLPLHKGAVHMAGCHVPGHTEFLQQLTAAPETRMAFVSPTLSVVLHTIHQSLRSVIEGLEAESVARTLLFTARHMRSLVPGRTLRIALAALNPHAGEGGAFGSEETCLEEALVQARAACPDPGVSFSGPHPADTLFQRAHTGHFDVVVALYHDQGLIPIKLVEPTRAVNLTLGLPFIRTSPDHGTAFDIAGQWKAGGENLFSAAELALRLSGSPTP